MPPTLPQGALPLNLKIILVVSDSAEKDQYLHALEEHDAHCCVVSSLAEASAHASEEPHSGIAIDVRQMLRVTASNKGAVDDLLNGLPSATLNITALREVRLLPRGALAAHCSSIGGFITACSHFAAKIIYHRDRTSTHYNVLLDSDPGFPSPFRTVCIDLSAGGCFLFYGSEEIRTGNTVWIKFPDNISVEGVKATVCWSRAWGTSQCIPGLGVNFEGFRFADRPHG
jgi:hypothetical protein